MSVETWVFEQLAAYGWARDETHQLRAGTRKYETAVGLKQASVRLNRGSEHERYYLTAYYESEGRNAAACCFAFIPMTASEDEVATAVDAFIDAVDKAISETYAVRLIKAA
ncbi:hypothetical protein KTD31_01710 [Burkholderia multivorans]|uniref:hypothetical protein n=1 Tax=Burkholderia multivorans TaxID=87883 RepID=UPI001C23817C|nr:hypothetical protein [Burkholderia multivorans]MBU9200119.1 hypothetical protein [Burkholderia multivorans]MDN8078759.1 hypothetical protein [Burkholderia multivorans]